MCIYIYIYIYCNCVGFHLFTLWVCGEWSISEVDLLYNYNPPPTHTHTKISSQLKWFLIVFFNFFPFLFSHGSPLQYEKILLYKQNFLTEIKGPSYAKRVKNISLFLILYLPKSVGVYVKKYLICMKLIWKSLEYFYLYS